MLEFCCTLSNHYFQSKIRCNLSAKSYMLVVVNDNVKNRVCNNYKNNDNVDGGYLGFGSFNQSRFLFCSNTGRTPSCSRNVNVVQSLRWSPKLNFNLSLSSLNRILVLKNWWDEKWEMRNEIERGEDEDGDGIMLFWDFFCLP